MVMVAALDVIEVFDTLDPSPTAAMRSVPARPTTGTWRALEPVPLRVPKLMNCGAL